MEKRRLHIGWRVTLAFLALMALSAIAFFAWNWGRAFLERGMERTPSVPISILGIALEQEMTPSDFVRVFESKEPKCWKDPTIELRREDVSCSAWVPYAGSYVTLNVDISEGKVGRIYLRSFCFEGGDLSSVRSALLMKFGTPRYPNGKAFPIGACTTPKDARYDDHDYMEWVSAIGKLVMNDWRTLRIEAQSKRDRELLERRAKEITRRNVDKAAI